MSRARPRRLIFLLFLLAGLTAVLLARLRPPSGPRPAGLAPAARAPARGGIAKDLPRTLWRDPIAAIDPATLVLASSAPDENGVDRVGEALALYRDFVTTLALTPQQVGQLQVAIYVAQDAWLSADHAFHERVLAGIAPGAGAASDADRVEAAATHAWSGSLLAGDDSPRAQAAAELNERLQRLLAPDQLPRALAHPFLPELRHLDERLIERR
jgi:hypothetical protein